MDKFRRKDGVWEKSDETPLNESDIEELKQITYLKQLKRMSESKNPKFHRTEEEKDLSFAFSQSYHDILQLIEETIIKEVSIVKKIKTPSLKVEQCRKAIDAFYEAKAFCYTKGKGGQIYFDDMWEHCHNSKSDCYSFIQSTKDQLARLKRLHY